MDGLLSGRPINLDPIGLRGVPESEIVAEITQQMPLGEIPAEEDVAEAVAFFCSDRARMITGETLQVNAGQLMR